MTDDVDSARLMYVVLSTIRANLAFEPDHTVG